MKIIIDARPLMWHIGGGVPVFTRQLLTELSKRHDHEYVLWQNAWKKLPLEPGLEHLKTIQTRIPNKLLNPALRTLHFPRLDALTGEADVFFLPNLNFVTRPKHGKVIVTVHDLSFVRSPHFFSTRQQLWHKALQLGKLFNLVDHIVVVSEHTKHDLLELFPKVSAEKVSVIGLGIEAPPVSGQLVLETQSRYNLTKPYFLHVGTLEPRKNIVNLMAAFETVANTKELSEFDLVLVGAKGWGAREVEREHKKSSVRNRIKILGGISDPDKHALMAGAKLFVYPSWYEGFGIPPLEAARHGVPVIASSVTSMPEVMGNAAFLVNPWDVSGLGQAMVAMIADDTLRAQFAKAGQIQAQKYQWKDVAEKLVKVFEK